MFPTGLHGSPSILHSLGLLCSFLVQSIGGGDCPFLNGKIISRGKWSNFLGWQVLTGFNLPICSGLNWSPDRDLEVLLVQVIVVWVMGGIVLLSNIHCLKRHMNISFVKHLLLQTAKMWLIKKSPDFNIFCCPPVIFKLILLKYEGVWL